MNPYEILGIEESTPIHKVHIFYGAQHKVYLEKRTELLGLTDQTSDIEWYKAYREKCESPDIDEPWNQYERNLAAIEKAYAEIGRGLPPHEALGVSDIASIDAILEACRSLLEQGARPSPYIEPAFIGMYIAIKEKGNDSDARPDEGTHRINSYTDEAYDTWWQLTLSVHCRDELFAEEVYS